MKHLIRLITLAALLPLTAIAAPGDETVVIRNDGDKTFYEYRVNGEITEIKVVPKVGKPYYLVPDQNVDGDYVRRDHPEIQAPKWVIFRW